MVSDDVPDFPRQDGGGESFFTAQQLAERWQVDRETVYRRSSTALPYLKLGSRTKRYRRQDVIAFEERNRLGPDST